MGGSEQQPLLERRNSARLQERQQFQQSQQQVVLNLATAGRGFLARLLMVSFWLCMSAMALLWVYLYFGSVYIIIFHLDKPCDQPLGGWLVCWMVLPSLLALIDPGPPRETGYFNEQARRWHSVRCGFVHALWFGVGCAEFQWAKTCQMTNHQLYIWVRFVIHIYLFGVFLFVICPLMLAFCWLQAFRLYRELIDRGWISNPKAASAETVDSLEIVPYDPSLFAAEDGSVDLRPSGECCCCQDNFGPELLIVRTPCGHYYHKECIGEWLKMAKSCPLCRCDLDTSGKHEDVSEQASPELGLANSASEDDEEMARRLQAEENQWVRY